MCEQSKVWMTVTQNQELSAPPKNSENGGQKNRNGKTSAIFFYHVFY